MEVREGLLYAKSHEWVKEEGDVVTIGLTDYAQSELGDLVFVNLPEEGDGASITRGLQQASANGICVAREICKKMNV